MGIFREALEFIHIVLGILMIIPTFCLIAYLGFFYNGIYGLSWSALFVGILSVIAIRREDNGKKAQYAPEIQIGSDRQRKAIDELVTLLDKQQTKKRSFLERLWYSL